MTGPKMSDRAVTTLRRNALLWMRDEIELWSPSTSSHDDLTLLEEHTDGTKEWEGVARISPTRGPREMSIGDAVIALRDADVLIPHSAPSPYKDQEIYIKASLDPELVGRWGKVTDARVFSQQAARKFSITMTQKSRVFDHVSPPEPDPPEDPEEGEDD